VESYIKRNIILYSKERRSRRKISYCRRKIKDKRYSMEANKTDEEKEKKKTTTSEASRLFNPQNKDLRRC
jgi:hypothetical protein